MPPPPHSSGSHTTFLLPFGPPPRLHLRKIITPPVPATKLTGSLNRARNEIRTHRSFDFKSVEDQSHLRCLVAASDGIAFIADGSVLPRRSGSDDRPMEAERGVVPFQSPESLRSEFRLPHRGVVKGMLVPRGVTVIVGGGFHGRFCEREGGVALGLSCPALSPLLFLHAGFAGLDLNGRGERYSICCAGTAGLTRRYVCDEVWRS